MSEPDITIINDQNELIHFCGALKTSDVIYVDTEFHRESTYWPTLCLIQAANDSVEAIIDPQIEGIDLTPFLDLLMDPTITKVFHAARQDMEIFYRLTGKPRLHDHLQSRTICLSMSAFLPSACKHCAGR